MNESSKLSLLGSFAGIIFFPKVLGGLGSSGRLVGTISTYPGTCKCPWSRVTANSTGGMFLPSTVCLGHVWEIVG